MPNVVAKGKPARLLLSLAALLLSACATPRPVTDFMLDLQTFPGGAVVEGRPRLDRAGRTDGLRAVVPFVAQWRRPPVTAAETADAYALLEEAVPIEEAMQTLLEGKELWSFAYYGTLSELQARLSAGLVPLVMVQDDPARVDTRRYMLVTGISPATEKVLVDEGDGRHVVYTYPQYRRLWRPVRNWMMIAAPPDRITWKPRMLEHVALARYHERRGEQEAAMAAFDRAAVLAPDNLDLMLARADSHYRMANLSAAMALYQAVLQRDGLNARAANNLAYALARSRGDLDEAEQLVRRALTIEPSNPVFLDTMGLVLIEKGRPREAADLLARAFHRFDNLPVGDKRQIVSRLVEAYEASSQPHLARQVLLDYRQADPQYVIPGNGPEDALPIDAGSLDLPGVNR